jgi:hypothetical protein
MTSSSVFGSGYLIDKRQIVRSCPDSDRRPQTRDAPIYVKHSADLPVAQTKTVTAIQSTDT